jgi:NhaP-type Na+/H+ or K+/H+ antiporter
VLGGFLLRLAQRSKWSQASNRSIFVLALALLSYSLSIEFGGNGFIAAFVGGLAFGKLLTDDVREQTIDFDAKVGELLSLIVWFMFGAVMVTALDAVTWRTVVFAVLALTLIRMLPVALALLGSHLDRTTVAFVGWFGPRGLASIVFGLLAADDLVGPDAKVVLAAITLTVLLSVVAHGLTASPLARRYGAHAGEIPAGIAIAD